MPSVRQVHDAAVALRFRAGKPLVHAGGVSDAGGDARRVLLLSLLNGFLCGFPAATPGKSSRSAPHFPRASAGEWSGCGLPASCVPPTTQRRRAWPPWAINKRNAPPLTDLLP